MSELEMKLRELVELLAITYHYEINDEFHIQIKLPDFRIISYTIPFKETE